jgi:hypothetical protein
VYKRLIKHLASSIILTLWSLCGLYAQLSPGELAADHSHLEGMTNCTQCHILGNKITNEKCLACHTEVQDRITLKKGYHSSAEVNGKECFACHSDHHGKNFQLIRFDITKFDHTLSGYNLSSPHAKKKCDDCHNQKFITDQKIKAKKYTYLGLKTECLTCHTDYHQKTLSVDCLTCHNEDSFKPAAKFDHSKTKFLLYGKHKSVDCQKCHKVEAANDNKTRSFRVAEYKSCTNCHKDPHLNKFGQDCRQCHNEESFKNTNIKGGKDFDHNKTDFKLEGKHIGVACASCHKKKVTDPLKHDKCINCHSDYHNKQFVKKGLIPDCSQCHNVKGFTTSSYSIEQHNKSTFPLKGAHEATPCLDCHRKQVKWNFKGIGTVCKDCHKDVHIRIIPAKYYPNGDCKICHNESKWAAITSFDHTKTEFALTGAHLKQSCRTCHFKPDSKGVIQQNYSELPDKCAECHKDNHLNQFVINGITDCTRCHDTENWKASKFDHNKTAFKLDGKHVNVPCAKCHKPQQQQGTTFYVKYKLNDFRCESCHS